MREGDYYPELRHAQVEPAQMQFRRQPPPDWTLYHREMMATWRNNEKIDVIEAVKITMPKEDFERLMSIYTCHYHAANQNPAVAEAWSQYKMLVALTNR